MSRILDRLGHAERLRHDNEGFPPVPGAESLLSPPDVTAYRGLLLLYLPAPAPGFFRSRPFLAALILCAWLLFIGLS